MLTILAKILKALNSEQSPTQIAAAVCLAVIVGFTPLLSLHNIIILCLVLLLRVNLSMFLVAWPMFTLLGLLITPITEAMGTSILHSRAMQPMWESFYNTLIGRWSSFYYTGMMGSIVFSPILAIILYPLLTLFIANYRNKWLERIEQFQIIKMLKASKLWQIYEGFSN